MSQLDYSIYPSVAVIGMLADPGHNDIVSAESLSTPTFDVAVAVVQNTTAYSVTFPLATPVTATFTSSGSATTANIMAGLVAAINALTGANAVPFTAVAVDPVNGPILLKGTNGGVAIIPTTTGNLSVAADGGAIPFGTIVVMDSLPTAGAPLSARKCRLPALASDIGNLTLGMAIATQFSEQPYLPVPGMRPFGAAGSPVPSYLAQASVNVLRQGRAWAAPETNVNPGDPVYVRFATGSGSQKGALRNNADGTAQVATITPTAVNSTEYQLVVNGRFYGFTSSGAATPTNIVAGLTAAIAADPLAVVTPTGSTTLILTAKTAGAAFTAQGDANLAVAATTPNAATCALLPGAKFLDIATGVLAYGTGGASSLSRVQLTIV